MFHKASRDLLAASEAGTGSTDHWLWGRTPEKRRTSSSAWQSETLEIRTVPAIATNVEGDWAFNGQATRIEQNGNSLVLTNENGSQAAAQLVSNSRIEISGWGGMFATVEGNKITFSNNSVWTRTSTPDISGSWTYNAQDTYIEQSGDSATVVNEFGARSAVTFFNNNTQIRATDWGNLVGTLSANNGRITWSNGSTWIKDGALNPPNLSGSYLYNGQTAAIQQSGINLTFTNEFGAVSSGRFLTDTQVQATDWNLNGLIVGDEIRWSNGVVWNKAVNPQINLAGNWQINGRFTSIQQTTDRLLLTNEAGQTSQAVFTSQTQIQALDWGNLSGRISNLGTRITWSNGSIWTRVS